MPTEDLEQIRAAATARGVSLQSYLRDAVHTQASFLRRQEALNRAANRLHGRPEVPAEERQAVLDAIETAHVSRADELGDRATR
ncbi:MAG: hypothetical protein ACRDZQ_01150 [Acidimicrobiales bacterium]